MATNDPNYSFLDSLAVVLTKTKTNTKVRLADIFDILAGKGYAALLILFSLPFCLPIQIPGFSTPFGIVLGFLGLRIAFGKHLWWPRWILDKSFSSEHIAALTIKTMKVVSKLQKILHPRLTFLTQNPILHRMHGLLVFFLAVLLSLPLPIPFTNMLSAFPLLFLGLGLLEDDGAAIIIAYCLAIACFAFFLGLFLLGKSQIGQYL